MNDKRRKPDPAVDMNVTWVSPQFKSEAMVYNEKYGSYFLKVGSIRPTYLSEVPKDQEDRWTVTLRNSKGPIRDNEGKIVEFNWLFLRPIDWQEAA